MLNRDRQIFTGNCWPGESVWIDYLNENAQAFWKKQMREMEGTNDLYSFWNDMNEPSVFSEKDLAMPLDNLHVRRNGSWVSHGELHNLYGSL